MSPVVGFIATAQLAKGHSDRKGSQSFLLSLDEGILHKSCILVYFSVCN